MKVVYNEQYNFNHIQAEEDMVITDYVEGSDIIDYNSFKQAYCPVNVDLTVYYEITDGKDAEYRELQQKAIDELRLKDKE